MERSSASNDPCQPFIAERKFFIRIQKVVANWLRLQSATSPCTKSTYFVSSAVKSGSIK